MCGCRTQFFANVVFLKLETDWWDSGEWGWKLMTLMMIMLLIILIKVDDDGNDNDGDDDTSWWWWWKLMKMMMMVTIMVNVCDDHCYLVMKVISVKEVISCDVSPVAMFTCELFSISTMASSKIYLFPLSPPRGSGCGNWIYFCFYLPPSVNPFTFTSTNLPPASPPPPITQKLQNLKRSGKII